MGFRRRHRGSGGHRYPATHPRVVRRARAVQALRAQLGPLCATSLAQPGHPPSSLTKPSTDQAQPAPPGTPPNFARSAPECPALHSLNPARHRPRPAQLDVLPSLAHSARHTTEPSLPSSAYCRASLLRPVNPGFAHSARQPELAGPAGRSAWHSRTSLASAPAYCPASLTLLSTPSSFACPFGVLSASLASLDILPSLASAYRLSSAQPHDQLTPSFQLNRSTNSRLAQPELRRLRSPGRSAGPMPTFQRRPTAGPRSSASAPGNAGLRNRFDPRPGRACQARPGRPPLSRRGTDLADPSGRLMTSVLERPVRWIHALCPAGAEPGHVPHLTEPPAPWPPVVRPIQL